MGLRRAFKLSASGNYSDRDIAEFLNQDVVRYQGKDYRLRSKGKPGEEGRLGPCLFLKDSMRELSTVTMASMAVR